MGDGESGVEEPASQVGGVQSHRVVAKRDSSYPFEPHWECICGYLFKSSVMGYPLFREFKTHKGEANGG